MLLKRPQNPNIGWMAYCDSSTQYFMQSTVASKFKKALHISIFFFLSFFHQRKILFSLILLCRCLFVYVLSQRFVHQTHAIAFWAFAFCLMHTAHRTRDPVHGIIYNIQARSSYTASTWHTHTQNGLHRLRNFQTKTKFKREQSKNKDAKSGQARITSHYTLHTPHMCNVNEK